MTFGLPSWLKSRFKGLNYEVPVWYPSSDEPDCREWLVTNDLGGYSSSTISDVHTRRYHAVLVSALRQPVDRHVILSRVQEQLSLDGKEYDLSTNHWASGVVAPTGYKFIESFTIVPAPTWVYNLDGHYLIKQLCLVRESDSVHIGYYWLPDLERSSGKAELNVKLLAGFRDIHGQVSGSGDRCYNQSLSANQSIIYLNNSASALEVNWVNAKYEPKSQWWWAYHWPEETARGLPDQEDLLLIGNLTTNLEFGKEFDFSVSLDHSDQPPSCRAAVEANLAHQSKLLSTAALPRSPETNLLVFACSQFLVKRSAKRVQNLDPEKTIAGLAAACNAVTRGSSSGTNFGGSPDSDKSSILIEQLDGAAALPAGSVASSARAGEPPALPGKASNGASDITTAGIARETSATLPGRASNGASDITTAGIARETSATLPGKASNGASDITTAGIARETSATLPGRASGGSSAAASAVLENPALKSLPAETSRLTSVMVGYPWFNDAGREAMISLPGLTLATRQFTQAKDILSLYSSFVQNGVMANRFFDNESEPEFKAVDPTLWWAWALLHFYRATKDKEFTRLQFSLLKKAALRYIEGTASGIMVDPLDGLLRCGQPGVELTWMDELVENIPITPRAGKPIEICALWHNLLGTLCHLAEELNEDAGQFKEYFAQSGKSMQKFWNDKLQCLYDVLEPLTRNPAKPDDTVRPNQLLAISLPFRAFTKAQEKSILALIDAELLSTIGIRSLSPTDASYQGRYGCGIAHADQYHRDLSYHQGTVWPWLIGAYCDAQTNVYGDNPETLAKIRILLQPLLNHLIDEGCVGSISEIFDGNTPHLPRGCFAHAPAVAEIMRTLAHVLRQQA